MTDNEALSTDQTETGISKGTKICIGKDTCPLQWSTVLVLNCHEKVGVVRIQMQESHPFTVVKVIKVQKKQK